ncbi:hypothetical protein BDN70DRAFT_934689 [Pholiota conissans]|uniref:HMG box domain-containing protein n=1 Tax=Pholiota conissans TaxID=109636 RepID=A0A9P5YW40_9AGAR|nr:hypothetical protein BDN70DRAFT_934689 [Pholiota conissans]
MPPDHARDVVSEEFDDDDMPPPVDNATSPTYTFSPGMTPLSFSSTSAPPTATQDLSPQPSSSSFISNSPVSPLTPDESTRPFPMPTATQSRPHGKRRDPSYIPRPPNAFILFRCAFIKEQNVPGKVEGNHSRLSKIIGMFFFFGLCWKQLPPEEREKWEAKAVVAQAEHRAHYPDWRFRPGANAMAKLKVKDGLAAGTSRRRTARSRTKDAPPAEEDAQSAGSETKGKGKDKGKGKAKVSHTVSLEETRCAKIAGFVAEGIKGEELEVAVKQWEGDHRIPRTTAHPPKSKAPRPSTSHARSRSDLAVATHSVPSTKLGHDVPSETSTPANTSSPRTFTSDDNSPRTSTRSANTPNTTLKPDVVDSASTLSDVSLTHMFKRSLSAPISNDRLPHLPSSSSDPSDSSTDEFSPTSAEPSPGMWGSFKASVLHASGDAPTGTHSIHRGRDSISFPITSGPATVTAGTGSAYDSPQQQQQQQFTWQEAENRRRLEEIQDPDLWWTQKPHADIVETPFGYGEPRSPAVTVSTNDMGYEVAQGGSEFDRNYLKHYGSFDAPQDGSQQVKWADMSSSHNRQGLAVVLEDPYGDDCTTTTTADPSSVSASPPTLSLPSLSAGGGSSGYYYSPMSPTPSSSFSTLTGWAGEYKHHSMADFAPWPDNHHHHHNHNNTAAGSSPATSSSPWYTTENAPAWGTAPQLQHSHMAQEASDWDHLEYRAAGDLHLPVEPPRRLLSFQEELRRANSSNS